MELDSIMQPNRDRGEEVTIQLDEEDLRNVSSTQIALVGKVITDKVLNRGAIKNILLKAWEDVEGMQITDFGVNLFLFSFNSEEEILTILNKTPWYVMNKLISLQRWNSQVSLKEIVFNKVQFWVQLQELPLECMTVKCAEKILKFVGKVLEIEDPMIGGKWIRTFVRARVEIDIN